MKTFRQNLNALHRHNQRNHPYEMFTRSMTNAVNDTLTLRNLVDSVTPDFMGIAIQQMKKK
jgi:hypothetical protein